MGLVDQAGPDCEESGAREAPQTGCTKAMRPGALGGACGPGRGRVCFCVWSSVRGTGITLSPECIPTPSFSEGIVGPLEQVMAQELKTMLQVTQPSSGAFVFL